MSPGGIAAIICAVALLFIAVAVAYAVVRLGRFIDEASVSLAALTTETTPLIKESTRTLELVNSPLESFAKISKNVEQVTTKVRGSDGLYRSQWSCSESCECAYIRCSILKRSRKEKEEEG